MRKLMVLAGALLVVAVPSVAVGASPNDSATGSGRVATIFGTNADFSFSAHSGPAGQNAKGNLNLRSTDWFPPANNGTAAVTELLVVGNQACMIGPWKSSDPASWPFGPSFGSSVVLVEDNGQPSGTTPDRGLAFGVSGGGCALWLPVYAAFLQPLEHGNVVVRDAS